jgi:N-acetylmuramoyl-L-alanine amidase
MALSATAAAQRTDLAGLKFCIDPGHGGNNPANDRYVPQAGVEFWESESNFRKALHLDSLLTARGAWVILTRYTNTYPNDADEPTLSARSALANANNVNWFHSIHSNATGGTNTGTNFTLLLVKEDIPTRQPAFPDAVTMSNIMGPNITQMNRTTPRSVYTYLDYTFYGGTSGGFNLGVLKDLIMPGELSEGSFHDYYPETRRLMNQLYRRMEAYALRNSFMQYFGVPADTLGIIAGVQTDVANGQSVNYSRVRLLPVDRVVNGDGNLNGYYMFDNLPAGTYTLRFETPGYAQDSLQVTVGTGAVVFRDRALVSFGNPTILTQSPANNDTLFNPTWPVEVGFSKPMDTASVRGSFSITPSVSGRFVWTNSNARLSFDPDSILPFYVTFMVRMDTTARSADGRALDGNGDGVPDPFTLTFKTKYVDALTPRILTSSPASGATVQTTNHPVSITFDERLNQTTVNTSNFIIQEIGGSIQARSLNYYEANNRGGVTMTLPGGLKPGKSYRMRVSRVGDLVGNVMGTAESILWDFSVGPDSWSFLVVDSLNPPALSFTTPVTSGATQASLSAVSSPAAPAVPGNPGSMQLTYSWDTTAADWLISMPAGEELHRNHSWVPDVILQAYMFGDGSGSQFRFMGVDSNLASGTISPYAGPWRPIDWVGWKLVEWDVARDSVDGVILPLAGALHLDAIELRYVPGVSKPGGTLLVDQLQTAHPLVTGAEPVTRALPEAFALHQAYPNPFNPSTTVAFDLPLGARVQLSVFDVLGRDVRSLADGWYAPGHHRAVWNAADARGRRATSGMYILRMVARDAAGGLLYTHAVKLLLMK